MTDLLQYTLSGLTNGSVYAIVALSLTIVFNSSGVINFAQGSYVVIGALTFATLSAQSVPIFLAIPVALLIVGSIGAFVYAMTVAPVPQSSHFVSISISLGVSIVLDKLAQFVWGTEYYALPEFFNTPPLKFLGATITSQAVVILSLSALIMMCLYLFFKYTRPGQAVLACSENRDAAGLVGINVNRVSLFAYVLGAALGAFAGTIILPMMTISTSAGLFLSLKGFAACVLGGFGSPVGAVIGGLVLGLMEAYGVGFISSGYQELIAFSVVIIILMIRPGGIVGTRALHS